MCYMLSYCIYLLLCTRRYSGALYRQLAVKSQLWVSVGISGYGLVLWSMELGSTDQLVVPD